jgi:DNA invertase Pin-like site-specific DNA recombinase
VDFASPVGKLCISMLAVIAEFERDLTRERTKESMAYARKQGGGGGQPRCGTEQGFRASFEQEDGAGEGRRVLPMGRARTAVPLGTLRKTRSQIEPGMWRG